VVLEGVEPSRARLAIDALRAGGIAAVLHAGIDGGVDGGRDADAYAAGARFTHLVEPAADGDGFRVRRAGAPEGSSITADLDALVRVLGQDQMTEEERCLRS
jgi:hypothetical protein